MSTSNEPGNTHNYTAGRDLYKSDGTLIVNHNGVRRARTGKFLLVLLAVDVVAFFVGMLAYTGHNTSGDTWRAGIFLLLLVLTGSVFRRWVSPRR